MEYAVQTRDYNHDYRWSWEESGSDSLRAKVSLELQNLIEDGKPGVAVIFREGSYHVIITAIYKLGDKPLGTDFSSATIRLNLVFSQITLEKAKGIVRYYLDNQSNPGAAFSDIVLWSNNRDKWKINEDQIVAAFNSIPEIPASGIVLNCEKGSELQSLLDYDWSQTEGAKYVYQPRSSVPVRIAVDPIPEKPLPPPEPPKISYWKRSLLLFLLLLAALAGLAYQSVNLYQTKKKVDELSAGSPTESQEYKKLENEFKILKYEELPKCTTELQKLKDKLTKTTGTSDVEVAVDKISNFQGQLDNIQGQLDKATKDKQKAEEDLRLANDAKATAESERDTANDAKATAEKNFKDLNTKFTVLKGDYDKLIGTIDIEGHFDPPQGGHYYNVNDPELLIRLKKESQ